MPHRKKKHYEELMVRMTKAIEAKFYLEASWYAYSILEDRMISALMASGGAHDSRKKLFRTLGRKIGIIEDRAKKDSLLRAYFDAPLIAALTQWKNERDALMHAMADAATPLQVVDKQAYLLATHGKDLVKTACRNVRLLKRNRHQIPIPP
jgi:hypothetical protein